MLESLRSRIRRSSISSYTKPSSTRPSATSKGETDVVYSKFLESWEQLEAQIRRVKTALPTIHDPLHRQQFLAEMERSTKSFRIASERLAKTLPWDSLARQDIERMSSEIAVEAEAEEKRQESLLYNHSAPISVPMGTGYSSHSHYSHHKPNPTIRIEETPFGSMSPPTMSAGTSYSSYYPPTTYIDSPTFSSSYGSHTAHPSSTSYHPYPYDSIPMTPAYSNSSQFPPAHHATSHLSPAFSPKIPSVYPPSPSISSPHIGHGRPHGGSQLAKFSSSYASTEMSYDSYEAMDYETVPYTRYY